MIRIDPQAYYEDHVVRMMGLDGDALERARGRGELRFKDVGGTPVYKGAWLIEWLDRAEREPAAAGGKAAR